MKRITAKYAGKCGRCGGRFDAGDAIMWTRGYSEHAVCDATANHSMNLAIQDWDEYQAEAALIAREEREYLQGYHAVAQIQAMAPAGSALREQMYLEMEQAAYNRGEDY